MSPSVVLVYGGAICEPDLEFQQREIEVKEISYTSVGSASP